MDNFCVVRTEIQFFCLSFIFHSGDFFGKKRTLSVSECSVKRGLFHTKVGISLPIFPQQNKVCSTILVESLSFNCCYLQKPEILENLLKLNNFLTQNIPNIISTLMLSQSHLPLKLGTGFAAPMKHPGFRPLAKYSDNTQRGNRLDPDTDLLIFSNSAKPCIQSPLALFQW